MNNCLQKSKALRAISTALCLTSLLVNNAGAAVFYWDPNGTTSIGGDGIWSTNTSSKIWSPIFAQTNTANLISWVGTNAAGFCAGPSSGVNQGTFTITVTNPLPMAGIFNGNLNPGPCVVTITNGGNGSFIVSNNAAMATGGSGPPSGTTIIYIPFTGPGSIVPQGGGGNLYLRATNTHTGGVFLGFTGLSWTSVLNFNNPAAFGTGPINLENTGSATGVGALLLEGSAAVTVTNPVTVVSLPAVAAPHLNIVGNPAGLTFSGSWTLQTNVSLGSGVIGSPVTISGPIGGAFTLGKFNPGTLIFSATNTYTGNTTVSNGVLQLGDSVGRNGTVAGTITVTSPGTLVWANPTGLTYAKVISGTGAVTNSGPGVLTLTAAATYTGGGTINGGTLKLGVANAIPNGPGKGDLTVDGGTLDLATFACSVNGLWGSTGIIDNSTGVGPYTLTVGNNNANSSFAGTIRNTSGTVALTKTGTGTITLSGANTYIGLTTVNAGTLQSGANGAIPAPSILVVASASTLDLNNFNGTNVALSGAGSVINNNGTFILNGNANGPTGQVFQAYSDFSGTFSGAGAVLKSGTHAMALRGDNSGYGGSITLNAGTLSVGAAPNRLPTSITMSVPAGALFQLDANNQTIGSLNGNGSVNLGGGTLTVNQNGSDTFNGVIQNSELPGSSTVLGHGLRGYYYTNIDFTGLNTVRDDATVNMPDMTSLPWYSPTAKTNQISVRWVGQVLTTVAGQYVFSTKCDDGQRLWVNGTLWIDDWAGHAPTLKSGTNTLAANTRYDIVFEYFQNTAGGAAQLFWTPPGDSSVIIPASNLFLPGPGTLVKSGGGVQQLTAPSTYTGGTVVSGGTLQATNASVGTGNVSVADGAILELDSPTTINSSADLVLTPSTANVYLNFTGVNNIHAISFDGGNTYWPTGTYGPTSSGANHELSVFTGSGFLNVTANPTTNLLAASAGTVVYATGVNLTSTITGSGGTATGTVTFYDNGNFLGTATLGGTGVAILSVSNLLVTASPHSITSVYGGDATHSASMSAPVLITTTPGTVVPNPIIATKTYDGTSNATIASITFGGILDSDTNYVHISSGYTAFFSDQYVGVNKTVTITNMVLTGSLSGNYSLSTNALITTGTITNKVLYISGLTATSRFYNGTTNAGATGTAAVTNGIVSPDPITLSGTGVFNFLTKNSGTNKPVVVSGYTLSPNPGIATNYFLLLTNLSANITNFPIGINGLTANNKVYDGGTNATLSGSPAFNPAAFAGDDVSISGTPIASFATPTVANTKPVTVTGYVLAGADSSNYTLSQPTGLTANITQAGTTASISSSINPSMQTSNVTFVCTVTSSTPTTNPPTSTVRFFTNGIAVSPLVTVVSNSPTSSIATYSTALLPVGTNTVAAVYNGDVNFSGSLQVSTNQVVQSSTVCSQTNAILGIVSMGGNTYTLNFIGTYQAQYYVVAQTNLTQPMANWIPVLGSTNTVSNLGGAWSVIVSNPAPAFYRAKATSVCP
jgi:autotransporter-associated beta strand protein